MSLDVKVSQMIRAERTVVASYVMDHRNDTAWISGITESELLGNESLGVGSDVRRVASFMGKRIEYVNRVVVLVPRERLEMRSVKAPFPMRVTYTFDDGPDGTIVSVRVRGEPAAMYRVAGPLLARRVRRSVSSDLRTLKNLTERSAGDGGGAELAG